MFQGSLSNTHQQGKPRQLSTPLSNMSFADAYGAGRHSATLPRHISDLGVIDNDARLRSQSSGPELFFANNGLSGSVKPRSALKFFGSRSPLGFEVPELMSNDANADPRSLSKFSSFKASSRVLGAKLKSIFVPKGKLSTLKGEDAGSRRGSSEYDTSNSSGNSSSTRNLSFSRSTLSRWNGSQTGSTQPYSPLRQLFDPFDTNPNSQGQGSVHTRPSFSSVGGNSVLAVPNGPNAFLNEPPPNQNYQRSLGRKGGAKSLRALASFSRLKDVNRPKLEASPPKQAFKRPIEDVAPSPTAVAFPTEPTYVRQHQISSPTSSRHRRGRTGSDARSSRRRVPSNASSQGRRRVPSCAPPASLPTIVDVKTFRMSERDSWIHIEDVANSETDERDGSSVIPLTPLLQAQERPEGSLVSPRLPTFSFTPPLPTLMDERREQNLPQLPSPSRSPGGGFRFSATPSSILLPLSMGPGPSQNIPSFKISTASEVLSAAQNASYEQQQQNSASRMLSRSHSNLQQGRQNEDLRHQPSRESLPFPPRAKRHRSTTVSSRNSSCTGVSSPAEERSPAATPTDHTMNSLRTVSSSILNYGSELTPSRARPPSMMSNVDGQEEATEVLRQKLGMLSVWPPRSVGGSPSDQTRASELQQTPRLPNPAPQHPLPPLPGARPAGSQGTKEAQNSSRNNDSKSQEGADADEIGDNTLTDTPGPNTLSRVVCGGSRVSRSSDSMASILSYESTVASSTDEDIQSLIDGISADCHETATAVAVAQRAQQQQGLSVEGTTQRNRANASSTSVASSAYSDFQLSTALPVSSLPWAKASPMPSRGKDQTNAQAAQVHGRTGHNANEGDQTFGHAQSRIPVPSRRGGNEPGSLRESLTLPFPLPRPHAHNPNVPENSSREIMNSATNGGNNYYPPTSFQRYVQGQWSSQARGRNDQDGAQGGESSDGNNGQMLKRTSNSNQSYHSHHSHLSLVLAHLEESPCPPPRRRRAPLILGPSIQANF
ncbi:hypothetical protein A4X09_0g3935 [Tilletia walkeri]|uniref:Uncharacterized protein n=1 Tax=Tilletia walkeri TaxID=117179 RepID=A0A8X7T5K6_9BASI|nr:hypothetical protein A4X09_0g3935 [Tilletia walkeri]